MNEHLVTMQRLTERGRWRWTCSTRGCRARCPGAQHHSDIAAAIACSDAHHDGAPVRYYGAALSIVNPDAQTGVLW